MILMIFIFRHLGGIYLLLHSDSSVIFWGPKHQCVGSPPKNMASWDAILKIASPKTWMICGKNIPQFWETSRCTQIASTSYSSYRPHSSPNLKRRYLVVFFRPGSRFRGKSGGIIQIIPPFISMISLEYRIDIFIQ